MVCEMLNFVSRNENDIHAVGLEAVQIQNRPLMQAREQIEEAAIVVDQRTLVRLSSLHNDLDSLVIRSQGLEEWGRGGFIRHKARQDGSVFMPLIDSINGIIAREILNFKFF